MHYAIESVKKSLKFFLCHSLLAIHPFYLYALLHTNFTTASQSSTSGVFGTATLIHISLIMNYELQFPVQRNEDKFYYRNLSLQSSQVQMSPVNPFQSDTSVFGEYQFDVAGASQIQSHVDAYSKCYYSGNRLYPRLAPATNGVIQQDIPVLTPQQQQDHSVWFQMVQQGFGSMQCKPPFEWSQELHNKFMKAVDELGGLHKAKPAAILKKMSCYGLSRLTVKSHLQTCRRKEKIAETTGTMITGSTKAGTSEGKIDQDQDQTQHETASESLASNKDSELENENWGSVVAEHLKFIEAELEDMTSEELIREFTQPFCYSHII